MTLSEYLDAKKLTQQDFAAIMGVRQATVSRWCSGKAAPSIETAIAIERETGKRVRWKSWYPVLNKGAK